MRLYLIGQGRDALDYAHNWMAAGGVIVGIACPVWDRLYVLASELHIPWWDIPSDGHTHGMIPEGADRVIRIGVE